MSISADNTWIDIVNEGIKKERNDSLQDFNFTGYKTPLNPRHMGEMPVRKELFIRAQEVEQMKRDENLLKPRHIGVYRDELGFFRKDVIEDGNYTKMIIQPLKIPEAAKIEEWDWQAKLRKIGIPSRDDILSMIEVHSDYDPNTLNYNYCLVYFDESKGGPRIFKRVVISEDEISHLFNSEQNEYIHIKINDAKRELAEEVYMKYISKFIEEETKMNKNTVEKILEKIGRLGGQYKIDYNLSMFGTDDGDVNINLPLRALPELFNMEATCANPNQKKEKQWINGLPAVKKVETYNNRVVKVTFIDGTFTKSVCSENDTFDLDVGITICLMKRLFGQKGTAVYNQLLRDIHNVMDENEKVKKLEAEQKQLEKEKKRKNEEKRAAGRLKKKEEQIDIQKQAILRALDERDSAKKKVTKK